ncbi:MAG: hypothetical protein O3C40_28100 [Planctomycetota bacterium]|nr:hypothetical protein [Planctomycetota bacterium]
MPPGLTKEAQEERKRFEEAYRAYLEEANKVALSVLVWGQNPMGKTRLANKRIQIRDELIELGHNAMFSEDIDLSVEGLSEKSKEFAQARAADLIVILLEDSPGALAETHDFCNHPEIGPKVYAMIPDKYEAGYSGRGAIKDLDEAYGGVYWYEEGEIQSCNVRTRAIARAEALRHIVHRHGGRK